MISGGRKQASARLSYRHGPPLLPPICQPLTEMVSWSLPACHGLWTGLDGYQVSGESEKSIRAWRSRRHLETRSKLVVHVARAIRLTPLASSTANPHVAFAFFLLQPQWLVSESAAWRRCRALPLPLLPLLLNTANVKVHKGR